MLFQNADREQASALGEFDGVAEIVKADVQLVAEGHGALVESLAHVNDGIERLEAGQTSLALRTSAIESRP